MRAFLALLLLVAAMAPAAAPAQTANDPAPPGASTGPADGATATTARVTGTVDPNGSASTYRFEYGTTDAYGLQTAETSAGTGREGGPVEATLERLTASTTYHYRVVATNAAGVTRGEDRTFRTAAVTPNPAPPTAISAPARDIGTASATLVGRVDPNRAATTVRFEYGTSTRYGSRSREATAGAGDAALTVAVPVGGLRPRTTYHVRVVATNAAGVSRGRDRMFRTLADPRAVSVTLEPDRVALGGSLVVSGRVSGAGVDDLPVALEGQTFPYGTTPFVQLGATRDTSRSGAFSFSTGTLVSSTRLRVVTRSAIKVASPVVAALVRLRVGVRGARSAARPRLVTFSGTVTPATAGARVSVQRRTSTGRFVPVGRTGTVALDAGRSRYSLAVRRSRRTSTYRVSVLPPPDGPHVRGTSRELRLDGAR